jgi:Cytochrome P460
VSCRFSRETLALHVEGDLPDAATAATVRHLAACEECRRFLEELHATQALMKSVRRETVSPSECTAMRREVMTIINERPGTLGWGLRIERAIALGLRPSYGLAAFLLLGIVSVSVLAQIRPATPGRVSPAVLEGSDTLLRPDGYRHWTLVSGAGAADATSSGLPSGDRVYISPSSYQEYAKTGRFPEGTVLVWEPTAPERGVSHQGPHTTSSTLLVSLKDGTKFEGGWGFFDFSGTGGPPPTKARALPESRGCRTCHRQSAKSDLVLSMG